MWFIFRILKKISIFFLLTILTQVGGVFYLFSTWVNRKIAEKRKMNFLRRVVVHVFVYTLLTFTVVPVFASIFGRKALPLFGNESVQSLSVLTCLSNRHYVTQEMYEVVLNIATEYSSLNPNSKILYLDANFPFINGFPLLPHLSHDDGKKLDLAFSYDDIRDSDNPCNRAPTLFGYGSNESEILIEMSGELDCESLGYWQYNLIEKTLGRFKNVKICLNEERTADIIGILVKEKKIEKIFIEPFLKKRMKLTSDKIMFHGCHAVSHSDHIHFQIK